MLFLAQQRVKHAPPPRSQGRCTRVNPWPSRPTQQQQAAVMQWLRWPRYLKETWNSLMTCETRTQWLIKRSSVFLSVWKRRKILVPCRGSWKWTPCYLTNSLGLSWLICAAQIRAAECLNTSQTRCPLICVALQRSLNSLVTDMTFSKTVSLKLHEMFWLLKDEAWSSRGREINQIKQMPLAWLTRKSYGNLVLWEWILQKAC